MGDAMTEDELRAYIRQRRQYLDEQIRSGEKEKPKVLTCDKRGPSIRGGRVGGRRGYAGG